MFEDLFSGGYVKFEKEPKLINNNAFANERVESEIERIELLRQSMPKPSDKDDADDEFNDGFVEGLSPSRVEDLLESEDEEMPPPPTPEEVMELAINEATAEAERIRDDALAEAVSIKQNASEEGYHEGLAKAAKTEAQKSAALDEKARALQEDYDARCERLEKELVEELTKVYEHVFEVDLRYQKDFIANILKSVIRKNNGSRSIIIHVSDEDINDVRRHQQILQECAGAHVRLELFADSALEPSQCFLETDSGIIDCGLHTQLEELSKAMRLLSYT